MDSISIKAFVQILFLEPVIDYECIFVFSLKKKK